MKPRSGLFQRVNGLRLQWKLSLAFLMMAPLIAAAGGTGLVFISRINASVDSVAQVSVPIVHEATTFAGGRSDWALSEASRYVNIAVGYVSQAAGIQHAPKEGLAINVDQWDGYTADRRELFEFLADNGITDTVFLTGDIHMAWANDVPVKAATYPLSQSAATEFVVTSVTSDNLDDILKVAPHTVSLVAAGAVKAANRHVKWLDMDSHGYGVLDVTAERSQMDYYALSDKADPKATSAWIRSYRTLSGTQRVERADQPVR